MVYPSGADLATKSAPKLAPAPGLLSTKKVFLIANGEAKAGVIQKAVEGEVTTAFPASVMQMHEHGFVLVDESAASLLKP